MTDSVSDPNSDKRFRLVADEEGVAPAPLPQGVGKPPASPPKAPPAAVPAPDPEPNALELRLKQLEAENDELLCALYFMQQQYQELKNKEGR